MIAALVVLSVVCVSLLIVAAFAIGQAADAEERMHRHVETLNEQFATERERLLMAALAPDEVVSLRKLEVTAQTAIARAEQRQERRYEEAEDERRFEHIGGIGG